MLGKLNIFQRTMLQWNDMYPYNGAQVIRIPHPLDAPRLGHMINRELEHLGLTGLAIDKQKGTFHYNGGTAQNELKVIKDFQDIHGALQGEIEMQLNTPFPDDGRTNPFRFFVVQGEDAFYLGLIYLHAIAGAESITLLLKSFVTRYTNQNRPAFSCPLDLYPKGFGTLFLQNPRFLFQTVAMFPSSIAGMRRSSTPPYHDILDQRNGFTFFSLTPEQFQALMRTTKLWGITLNDLFLALLLKSLSPFASRRFSATRRRRQITVGSIVNIRKDLGINCLKSFGLFLGFFVVSHSAPEGISVENLAKEIRHQTFRIKLHKLYLGTPIYLWLGRFLLSLHSRDRQKRFYPEYYPLWGGLTNMNLNPLWEERDENRQIDYFRAVSTGPITPLALTVTTFRDIVNIGLTFKKTVFLKSEIEAFISDFLDSVNHLKGETGVRA